MQKYTHHLLSMACSIIILMVTLGIVGCLAGNRVASPDTHVDTRLETETGDIEAESVGIGGVVGTIGGKGDSIALWIAIIALAVGPVMYPVQRTIRVWRENGKNSGNKPSTKKRRKTDKCEKCGQ